MASPVPHGLSAPGGWILHGRHYRAADALAASDTAWLERLITRRVPLEDAKAAFAAAEDEVKVVSCGTGDGVTAASAARSGGCFAGDRRRRLEHHGLARRGVTVALLRCDGDEEVGPIVSADPS